MNHQRRRQLADAADALDTINQLLPKAKDTVEAVLKAEKEYVTNIPDPLKGSRRAAEANRIVKELEAAHNQIKGTDLMGVCHALNAALTAPDERHTFGAEREGMDRAAAALQELKSGVRGRKRQQAIQQLEAVVPQ